MSDHLQCSNPKVGIRPLKSDNGRGQHALPSVMAHEYVYNELSVSHADIGKSRIEIKYSLTELSPYGDKMLELYHNQLQIEK